MTINQSERLEAHEAFASVVGRKAAGTLMDELVELDSGIVGMNHKVDMLQAQMANLEKAFDSFANWNRAVFAMIFAVNVATFVLVFQMR